MLWLVVPGCFHLSRTKKGQAGVFDSSINKNLVGGLGSQTEFTLAALRTHEGFYCPVSRKYAASNSRYQQRSQDVWYVYLR